MISYLVVPTVERFADKIKNKEDDVTGGLIDSYVAGYETNQKLLAESNGLRVGTVFDHQFAYGFVISNQLLNNAEIEKCLRRTLSTKESWITEQIQKNMKALPVSLMISNISLTRGRQNADVTISVVSALCEH